MKKTIKTGALLVAGVLALSACGGSGEAADSAPAESSSPTPSATLAVGQVQYTAAELEAALTAVKADQGLAGEISNDAALRPNLSVAATAPDGLTIAPEQCMEVLGFSNFFGDLDNTNVAGMALSETEKLTLVSHSDAASLDRQVENNSNLLDDCAEVKMTGDGEGEVATGRTERLDASTEAPTTQAFAITMAADGMDFSGMKVAAVSGTTNIVVTVSETGDPDETLAKAEDMINTVLAELEK